MGTSMGRDWMPVRVLREFERSQMGTMRLLANWLNCCAQRVGMAQNQMAISHKQSSLGINTGVNPWGQSYLISFSIIWKIRINTSSSLQVTQKLGKQIDPPKMSLCTEIVTGWKTEPFQETH